MSSVMPRPEQTLGARGRFWAGLLHDAPHATVRDISDPRDGLFEPHRRVADWEKLTFSLLIQSNPQFR
jgi:hypothetical protein